MEDEKKTISTEETENNIETKEQKSTLDALLFDSDDRDGRVESDEEIHFEEFMAEYRDLISKNLSKAGKAKAEPENNSDNDSDDESEFLLSLPKKQEKKAKIKNNAQDNTWDDEITLAPEEYAELVDESEPLLDEIPEEEPEPDFDLGEKKEEKSDKFQLSINFEGETQDQTADEDEETPAKYDPDKPRKIDWVFDIAEMFVFVLVAVMIITTFLFKHSVVEGDSMNNTLQDGDHLIISDLFYTPERGDIIVFEDYSTSLKKAVVKRVIATPGDTVEVKINESGVYEVYIKGEYLDEPYAYTNIDHTAPGVGVWTVGEGEIFVMGDNRYNSTDSRDIGTVQIDSILGRVLFRFFPFDKFGGID